MSQPCGNGVPGSEHRRCKGPEAGRSSAVFRDQKGPRGWSRQNEEEEAKKGGCRGGRGRSGGPCGPWEGLWVLLNIETYAANRCSFPSSLNFFIIFQGRRSLFSKGGLPGPRRVQIGVGCLSPASGGAEWVPQGSCRSGVERGLHTLLLPTPSLLFSSAGN